MFNHKLEETASLKTHFDWFVLSFLAGNINTGGFLSCGRFVSHVTGFATLAGASLANGSVLETIGIVTIPGYFLIGVMISGYLTEKKHAYVAHGQKYAPVMGIVAGCLAVVTLAGALKLFGTFGDVSGLAHQYFLLALLCGACGLQNAAITSASGSTVRTTHLTGLTTDLGLGIVRAEIHYPSIAARTLGRKANLLRIGTILSFILGSLVGAIFFMRFQYLGFALPTLIAAYAAVSASRKV